MSEPLENIEAKPYGPESTQEEIAELRALVSEPMPNVIRYVEPPIVTCFQLDIFFDRIRELIAGRRRYGFLVDLSHAQRPERTVVDYLTEKYRTVSPTYVGVYTGRGIVMNVLAGMLLSRVMGRYKYSVHETEAEAAARVKQALMDSSIGARTAP